MLERLTIDDFAPLEGETFCIENPDVELRLERALAVMESERARLKRQPFSLFFRGPEEIPLPQGVYALRNDAFAEPLEIFIVPVGRKDQGYEYEAVFT